MDDFELKTRGDKETIVHHLRGCEYYSVFLELFEELFRKGRRYGYSDPALKELIEKNSGGMEIIESLETMFFDILNENDITI